MHKKRSCIDCDYKWKCDEPEKVCEKYRHTYTPVMNLTKKDGESFEFGRIEVKE